MREFVVALLSLGLVTIGQAHAQDWSFEPDAVHDRIETNTVGALVQYIRIYGYRCDTVSAARPMVLQTGFVVYCNRYNYEYEVVDRGGNWVVTLQ